MALNNSLIRGSVLWDRTKCVEICSFGLELWMDLATTLLCATCPLPICIDLSSVSGLSLCVCLLLSPSASSLHPVCTVRVHGGALQYGLPFDRLLGLWEQGGDGGHAARGQAILNWPVLCSPHPPPPHPSHTHPVPPET